MTLVKIDPAEYGVDMYLSYGTTDNFTGRALYKNSICYLHPEAANRLKSAVTMARAIGLKIKIFDAFRPLDVQQMLWDHTPDPEFISNPQTGRTPHCRGVAVDLTLIDERGKELDMGTAFDAFTPLSHHGNIDVSVEGQRNRHILMGIMTKAGWDFNPNEWWHYQLQNPVQYEKFTDAQAGTGML
jgi:D-alanyl-D-alanine dipeptidase